MSIQIFNNTLLKLICRQGTDAERKNITLESGELGYTTDTKRLYVGDGNVGGVLVGNIFKGSNPDITIFSPAEIGDLAFNDDAKVLYRLKQGEGSFLSDWEKIAQVGGINSNTAQAGGGSKIDNMVRVTSTEWSTLSSSADANTFYLISNNNYFLFENALLLDS
jgi:hypothetical protein